jgi:16S rRNA processing protein RimM
MIAVGRITKSVGLKGELNVSMLTDNPERFDKLKSVWIGADEEHAVKYTVLGVRHTRSAAVLKLEGVESRTEADERRGKLLFVAAKDAFVPKKGTYFIHDIVGMSVETESGEVIGTVQEVMQLPANDVWVVTKGEREYLIPAIKDVIRAVDVQRRVVMIHPLEGMLD